MYNSLIIICFCIKFSFNMQKEKPDSECLASLFGSDLEPFSTPLMEFPILAKLQVAFFFFIYPVLPVSRGRLFVRPLGLTRFFFPPFAVLYKSLNLNCRGIEDIQAHFRIFLHFKFQNATTSVRQNHQETAPTLSASLYFPLAFPSNYLLYSQNLYHSQCHGGTSSFNVTLLYNIYSRVTVSISLFLMSF